MQIWNKPSEEYILYHLLLYLLLLCQTCMRTFSKTMGENVTKQSINSDTSCAFMKNMSKANCNSQFFISLFPSSWLSSCNIKTVQFLHTCWHITQYTFLYTEKIYIYLYTYLYIPTHVWDELGVLCGWMCEYKYVGGDSCQVAPYIPFTSSCHSKAGLQHTHVLVCSVLSEFNQKQPCTWLDCRFKAINV